MLENKRQNERVAMSQNEQKEIMLNILDEFVSFCEKNNLKYYLDAGTLLGAVRHKGFIPWDDDIDVCMPRADYDKFCFLLRTKEKQITEHLYVEFPEDTIFPFLKIADNRTILIEYPESNPIEVGVYIDVFPKDGIKDSSINTKIICKISYIINLFRWFNVYSIYAWKNKNMLKRIIAFCGRKIIKYPNIPLYIQQKWIKRNNKKHPLEQCKYVTTLVNGEFEKRAPKECFSDYILLEFEGRKYKVPIGYDKYLRCLYPGDYMQLPPKDKQYKHNTIIYWKNIEEKEKYEEYGL